MRRLLSITSLLLPTLAPACLPGADQLAAGANLEVVVTGLRPAELVTIEVEEERFSRAADDAVIRFFLSLPAGRREGVVSLERDAVRRCAPFRTEVGAADRTIVGVDVGAAAPCAAPPVRHLISLEELVVGDCGDAACTTLTTFSGSGTVVVDAPGNGGGRGRGRAADADALRVEVLSSDADALFVDGACGQLGGPQRDHVELTRVIDDDGDLAAAVVDVSNCRLGIAARLRARLAILRDDVSDE